MSKKCPHCAESIQDEAKICRFCGNKVNSSKQYKLSKSCSIPIIIIGGIIVLAGVLNSNDNNTTTHNQNSTPSKTTTVTEQKAENKQYEKNNDELEKPISITAKKLNEVYEKNEIAADKLYKDKTLEINGTVNSIGEVFDSMFITLETDNMFMSVHCSLDDSERDKVAELEKGDTVIVTGKCDGMGLSVMIDDCKIIDVKSNNISKKEENTKEIKKEDEKDNTESESEKKPQIIPYEIITEEDISYAGCKRVALRITVDDYEEKNDVDYTMDLIVKKYKDKWEDITVWAYKNSEKNQVESLGYTMGMKEYSVCE